MPTIDSTNWTGRYLRPFLPLPRIERKPDAAPLRAERSPRVEVEVVTYHAAFALAVIFVCTVIGWGL